MAKPVKKTARARETWTFQPADDVKTAIEKFIAEAGGAEATPGYKTKLLNHALRVALAAGAADALASAEQQYRSMMAPATILERVPQPSVPAPSAKARSKTNS